jgi:hypothetical protein
MSESKLGKFVTGRVDYKRDAVHVAVALVTTWHEGLNPGDPVSMVRYCDDEVILCASRASCVGIVDPFLTRTILPGELFHILLRPGTVTNLRHEWDHPDFPKPEPEAPEDIDDGCSSC